MLPSWNPKKIQSMKKKIDEIARALSKAQGMIMPAEKTGFNDHRKYDYLELSGIVDACRSALAKNGLSFVQLFEREGEQIVLKTVLMHESGQYIASTLPLLATPDYHALGSACTYSRKYALASMLGIVAEGDDDDGEATMQKPVAPSAGAKARPRKSPKKKLPLDPWVDALAIIDKVEGARAMFEAKDIDVREMIPQVIEKVRAMGVDGLTKKVAEWQKEIAKKEAEAEKKALEENQAYALKVKLEKEEKFLEKRRQTIKAKEEEARSEEDGKEEGKA